MSQANDFQQVRNLFITGFVAYIEACRMGDLGGPSIWTPQPRHLGTPIKGVDDVAKFVHAHESDLQEMRALLKSHGFTESPQLEASDLGIRLASWAVTRWSLDRGHAVRAISTVLARTPNAADKILNQMLSSD